MTTVVPLLPLTEAPYTSVSILIFIGQKLAFKRKDSFSRELGKIETCKRNKESFTTSKSDEKS